MLRRRISIPIIIIWGLILTQAISTVFVYFSNADLYRTMEILNNAGYLIVPNEHIINRLHEFGPAFRGGLFFTLSLGSSLTLVSLLIGLIWTRLSKQRKIPVITLCLIQVLCLAEINKNGPCIIESLYFIFVPLGVFIAAIRLLPQNIKAEHRIHPLIHIIPLLILSVLWLSQMSKDIFVDLRDNFLLSNPVGIKINSFYYGYTLYPAGAFKTLKQKLIKTCNLEEVENPGAGKRLKHMLIRFDYLETKNNEQIDLKIIQKGNDLMFQNRGRVILSTSIEGFLKNPGRTLDSFSMMCDRHGFLRKAVYFSLLIGFPVILYIFLYSCLCFILSLFINNRISSYIVSTCGLIIGVLMLVPIYKSNSIVIDINNLGKILESENRFERIGALKLIARKGFDITEYESYTKNVESSYVPEIYWAVKALGNSRSPRAFDDLILTLDSPYSNVVCMAYYSLGRKGDKRAVDVILKRIRTSNHWYRQWYAYRALRNLGWKQRTSN